MLWALSKIAAFFALVLGLSLGVSVMSDGGGAIRIWAFSHEFTLGPIASVVALGVVIFSVWMGVKIVGLLFAVVGFLTGDENAFSRLFSKNRQNRGLRALSEGYLALAAGEPTTALARARTAGRLLDHPELTALLTAQAAEAAGDGRAACAAWKRLLNDERTRFVAVRGLMQQKLAKGDTETALKLAEQALALKPKHAETQDTLLKLQAGGGDWAGARQTLERKHRSGGLPRALYKRRDALLALQEAKVVLDSRSSIEAREAAIEANRLSPDLIPAAVIAAQSLAEQGDKKGATRVLKKAWGVQPHPDLAMAFAGLEPDESAAARLTRFKPLLAQHKDAAETHMTLAELRLAAGDFTGAKAALTAVLHDHPTQRAFTILAAAERGLGASDAEVRELLAQALVAPRGAQWCCDSCQAAWGDWTPICASCEGFDTLTWRVPAASGEEVAPQWAQLLLAQPVNAPNARAEMPLLEAEDIAPEKPRRFAEQGVSEVVDSQVLETPDEILRRAT